ncbi:unnamed protein product [Amoebophrya sp. A25]|nr:unnamed protein product [Amoebophrya sp. A25]|eukprot:GSA25T00002470001.1
MTRLEDAKDYSMDKKLLVAGDSYLEHQTTDKTKTPAQMIPTDMDTALDLTLDEQGGVAAIVEHHLDALRPKLEDEALSQKRIEMLSGRSGRQYQSTKNRLPASRSSASSPSSSASSASEEDDATMRLLLHQRNRVELGLAHSGMETALLGTLAEASMSKDQQTPIRNTEQGDEGLQQEVGCHRSLLENYEYLRRLQRNDPSEFPVSPVRHQKKFRNDDARDLGDDHILATSTEKALVDLRLMNMSRRGRKQNNDAEAPQAHAVEATAEASSSSTGALRQPLGLDLDTIRHAESPRRRKLSPGFGLNDDRNRGFAAFERELMFPSDREKKVEVDALEAGDTHEQKHDEDDEAKRHEKEEQNKKQQMEAKKAAAKLELEEKGGGNLLSMFTTRRDRDGSPEEDRNFLERVTAFGENINAVVDNTLTRFDQRLERAGKVLDRKSRKLAHQLNLDPPYIAVARINKEFEPNREERERLEALQRHEKMVAKKAWEQRESAFVEAVADDLISAKKTGRKVVKTLQRTGDEIKETAGKALGEVNVLPYVYKNVADGNLRQVMRTNLPKNAYTASSRGSSTSRSRKKKRRSKNGEGESTDMSKNGELGDELDADNYTDGGPGVELEPGEDRPEDQDSSDASSSPRSRKGQIKGKKGKKGKKKGAAGGQKGNSADGKGKKGLSKEGKKPSSKKNQSPRFGELQGGSDSDEGE